MSVRLTLICLAICVTGCAPRPPADANPHVEQLKTEVWRNRQTVELKGQRVEVAVSKDYGFALVDVGDLGPRFTVAEAETVAELASGCVAKDQGIFTMYTKHPDKSFAAKEVKDHLKRMYVPLWCI